MNKNNQLEVLRDTLLRCFLGLMVLTCWPAQASNEDLWQRVQSQLSLYQLDHRRIDAERSWYEGNPDYMRRVSERAIPYLHHVVEAVEKRGMPMELALLPIMETIRHLFSIRSPIHHR